MAIDESSARAVVRVLGEVESRVMTADEQREVAWWERETRDLTRPRGPTECVRCASGEFNVAHATKHVTACERHPARVRYERLTQIARAIGGRANRFEPVPGLQFETETRVPRYRFGTFADALTTLGQPDVTDQDRRDALELVRGHLRWRLNVLDREADPCPWCRRCFEVSAFADHLWRCPRHPATVRADVIEDELRAYLGDAGFGAAVRLELAREARMQLAELIAACHDYRQDMGYEAANVWYSKAWSERPWRRACAIAERYAAEVHADGARDDTLCVTLAALVQLTEACSAFWASMHDGDDGKSLISADHSTEWEARVAGAERVLERLAGRRGVTKR